MGNSAGHLNALSKDNEKIEVVYLKRKFSLKSL
jgi:hypothetical protein